MASGSRPYLCIEKNELTCARGMGIRNKEALKAYAATEIKKEKNRSTSSREN